MTAINQITANPASALVGFAGYGAPFRIPRTTAARNQPVIFRFSDGIISYINVFRLVRLVQTPLIGPVGPYDPLVWPHIGRMAWGFEVRLHL